MRPLGYLLLLAFVGGSLSVLSKLALRELPGFLFIGLRFMVAAAILAVVIGAMRKRLVWSVLKKFIPVACFWWLASLLFAFGLKSTNATTAQFIHAFIPIAVVIFSGLLLKQVFRKRQWLGVGVAVAGVMVVILSGGSLSLANDSLIGNVLVLLSAMGFALYAVYSKLPRYQDLDPIDMIFVGIVSGLIVSLPFAVWDLMRIGSVAGVSAASWVATVLAGLAIMLFFGGSQLLIKKLGPAHMSLNQYLIPLFVILWAAIVLHEQPKPVVLLGASIALLGVWLVTNPPRLSNH
jgi:drug/metabolite transporter (DMT)-like permease